MEKLYCSMCGKEKAISQFYTSNSPKFANENYKHRVCFCKNCCKKLVYKNKKIDKQAFIDFLRDKIDAPFFNDLYIDVLNSGREVVGTYIARLNAYPVVKKILKEKKSISYMDGEIENNQESNNIQQKSTLKNSQEQVIDDDFKVTKDIIKFWGKGYSNEQYFDLQRFYESFEKGYECNSPAQVLNFKNAAKTQLKADETLLKGEINSYNQLMKTLSNILGDSHVKPVQETEADGNNQVTFGTLIKKYEDERPIEENLDDEMKKYIDTFMVGHLAKMEGLNNDLVKKYDEAMEQYTIDFEKERLEKED